MARITDIERARRRMIVDRAEYLKDISDEFGEDRRSALERGDREEVSRLSEEFAPKRRDHRLEDERLGIRGASFVMVSTTMWYVWADIATEHEAIAWKAHADIAAWQASGEAQDPSNGLGRCLEASIVTVTASAHVVDGLYGAVCYLVPDPGRMTRWKRILVTLEELFEVSAIPSLETRMERLFDLRDQAVHPWDSIRVPVKHPDFPEMNVSMEVGTFSASEATTSLELALEILDQCTLHPRIRVGRRQTGKGLNGCSQIVTGQRRGSPGRRVGPRRCTSSKCPTECVDTAPGGFSSLLIPTPSLQLDGRGDTWPS